MLHLHNEGKGAIMVVDFFNSKLWIGNRHSLNQNSTCNIAGTAGRPR